MRVSTDWLLFAVEHRLSFQEGNSSRWCDNQRYRVWSKAKCSKKIRCQQEMIALMRRWRNKSVFVGSRWSAVMNGLKSRWRWSHYLFISPCTCLDMLFHNVPPPPTFIRKKSMCADACTQPMSHVHVHLCARSYERADIGVMFPSD